MTTVMVQFAGESVSCFAATIPLSFVEYSLLDSDSFYGLHHDREGLILIPSAFLLGLITRVHCAKDLTPLAFLRRLKLVGRQDVYLQRMHILHKSPY